MATQRPNLRDVGNAFLRVGLGCLLAAHGAQKTLGWFGGGGVDRTAAGFERMGFRPSRTMAHLAGWTQFVGGAALAAGLATPAAGAALAGTMVVAAAPSYRKGFWSIRGGYEYPAVLAISTLALTLAGPGRLSLDEATGHVLDRPWMRVVGAASVAPAAAVVLLRRRRMLQAERAAAAAAGSQQTQEPAPPSV